MIENWAEFICPSCKRQNKKEFAQIYNFIFKPDDECKVLCQFCNKVNFYHVHSVTYKLGNEPSIAKTEDDDTFWIIMILQKIKYVIVVVA